MELKVQTTCWTAFCRKYHKKIKDEGENFKRNPYYYMDNNSTIKLGNGDFEIYFWDDYTRCSDNPIIRYMSLRYLYTHEDIASVMIGGDSFRELRYAFDELDKARVTFANKLLS